jgi:hypothetical protein
MLITSGVFTLPGKHALLNHQLAYKVVLIDATETPVERPQKTAPVRFWSENAPRPEDATRFQQYHGQASLPRPRSGSPPRMSTVQSIRGPAASQPPPPPHHHGHRLPRCTETAEQHHFVLQTTSNLPSGHCHCGCRANSENQSDRVTAGAPRDESLDEHVSIRCSGDLHQQEVDFIRRGSKSGAARRFRVGETSVYC